MADIPCAFSRDMMAATLGVETHVLRPPYKNAQEFDYRLSRILRADFDYKDIFSASAMHGLEEGTVYDVRNTLELNYVFMPVPGPQPRSVLLFGPFLYEAASGAFFERVLAQNRIGKGDAAALRTFYGTVPEVEVGADISAWPAWVQPLGAGLGVYRTGDVRQHNGKLWRSTSL